MRGVVTIAGPITRGHFPAPAVSRGDAHNGRPDGGDRAQHCTLTPSQCLHPFTANMMHTLSAISTDI